MLKWIEVKKENTAYKLIQTLKYLCVLLVWVAFKILTQDYFGINDGVKVKDLSMFLSDPWEMLFVTVVFAPLLEEFMFRYPLKKRPFFVFALLTTLLLFKGFDPTHIIASVALIAFSAFVVLYQFIPNKPVWFFRVVCAVSVIAFTAVHSDNYPPNQLISMNLIEVSFLFSSQFILGVVTTHIRVKIGFWYGVLLHAMYNLILFCIWAYTNF